MPQGTIGELYISGDGVGKGYMNKEQQTNESFIINPFIDGKVMYKVGDLGAFDDKGEITCYGRIDNQVKIRGLRIELQEIEKRMQSVYNIHDCVVVKKVVKGKDALCAYYVERGHVSKSVLKTVLYSKLPEYMVPQYFVKMEQLPHTPNGKVDRKALPDPVIDENELEIVKPRNEIDKELIKIIEKMLQVDKVGINNTLLELGGDSLTAITLTTKVLSKFNVQLNIKDILSNYTIKDMSDYIAENQTKDISKIKIERIKEQDYYPLSSAQKRIYYNCKMIGEDNIVYNMPGGITVDEVLDIEKIKEVFYKIIKRHEILRTILIQQNDEIVQKVCKEINFNIPVYFNQEKEIDSIIKNFSKPFKLENEVLIRVEVHYIDNKKTMLLVDSHHIIMDGMSLNNLIIEFNRLYNGADLKRLPIQYRDYTMWENNYNKSNEILEHERYWVNKFEDCEFPPLNLPYDYKVSAIRSYEGNTITNVIDEKIFRKIEKYAKKIGMSSYMLFVSTFLILLHRYTGQDEIILGSPVANRNQKETKRMMGVLVNNIVIRSKLNEDETINEFFEKMKEQILSDISNQPYPFDMLIKKLNIKVDNSRNPMFDVMFTYQNKEENTVQLSGKSVNVLELDNNISKFNLSIEVKPKMHTINVEYCTKLFKKETIENLFEHYLYMLTDIIENVDAKIKDIDIITPKENKLLEKFNATDGEINNDTTAYLIEKQVDENPNNIAVICEDKVLTYKQLDDKANSLANYLIKIGVKSNDIVCIMTNRSLETIVAMYAVLKAGGAFLNVDPTYPVDRTKYYIESSRSQYVLTQKELKDRVKEIPNCIEIDLDNNIYQENKDRPKVNIKMEDLSYIIYTSGSTGVPKGVMLNQVGLTNMAKAMTKALDYLHDGKVHTLLSVTSTPFDIFVYEIIVSLTHGQRIVMANNAEHRNPKLLEKLMEKYNTDVMTVTPSLMKIVYDNRSENSPLRLVKNMVFGGEPLPEKFVKDLKALADDITVFNIYGPSEITVLSNVQNLNGEPEITTGPPIMNTQIHILDKNLNRVPIGVVGEIYISGIQVGVGYLGKEELTNQKFLQNKFGKGRMYKSGDIGRWTFEGKIQCLGRIDHQIKLRGLRIELGEIENKMEQYPGVSAAIVNKITINDKDSLCGYYVTDGTSNISELEIKSYLKKYLPQYMVPSYIVHLEKMPYTINRKIDRKALPMPNIEEENFKEEEPDKYDNDELKLLQIWKNILHLDKINLNDNFFDIGGDSISAIKMQIEALKYNFNFEYADIFKYPTIKELASKKRYNKNNNIQKYDYSEINKILKRNNLENLKKIQKYNVKDVLLIGGTGYLGIHILYEYLKYENGKIYCLVRRKNNEEPLIRLQQKIAFYFGNDYYEKNKDRIQVVEGDIVEENLAINSKDYKMLKNNITTVINAGALVKHFGISKLFNDINVKGTENVVEFCKKENKRLIHISTISVSGNGEKEETVEETTENINSKKIFKESDLYIGQNISGIYTITKFEAEKIVLKAIKSGLNAQILRMGNITNRYSDGVFQQNVEENAFAKRLKSFIELGMFPQYLLDHAIELGPVDLCAEAVIKILEYDSNCNVLHIYNSKLLPIKLLVNTMKELGINIEAVDDETMSRKLKEILNDNFKKEILSGIIHDIDSKKRLIYTSNIRVSYDFSEKYLEKIGFSWKNIDREYILKYMNYFKGIGFIEY
jgi:bacitracin synthase 3